LIVTVKIFVILEVFQKVNCATLDQLEQNQPVVRTAKPRAELSTSTSSILPFSAGSPPEFYFEPALIGFRCEGATDQTLDGVTVVEANSAIKITLFGEAFTTDTIVAFTSEIVGKTEFEPRPVGRAILEDTKHQPAQVQPGDNNSNSSPTDSLAIGTPTGGEQPANSSSAISSRSIPVIQTGVPKDQEAVVSQSPLGKEEIGKRRTPRIVQEPQGEAIRNPKLDRKFKRRLLDRTSYDCTDRDRVISYKLSEDNIITPNVAVLTVRLPELDWSSSGVYYYFCLKQPPVPSLSHGLISKTLELDSSELKLGANSSSAWMNAPPKLGQDLVWVHQGDEWWLALKVEPPILSVTNDCILIVLLLFLSAVTSGLNLGLMSLDMNELAVISSCGDQRERSYARTIAPLRKRGNYLLCSLLLGNVMVNSTLTVILEEMTSGLVAVIGSTLAIVVLGEIVPQAFCARQGLAIGAKTIYLTYAFMILTFPLSYPISCFLDCILGEEKGNVYDRERLMEFIRITGNHTNLEADEVAIISGALKLKKIKVDQIMTRIEDVFMLPIDCMLNRDTIKSIIEKGYSRIPVYEFGDRKQIVALILAKDLALLDPDDQVPLANMLMYCKHPLIFIENTATLDVALNEFKTGKSHMAIVRQIYDDGEVDKYYEAIGVVTLEDVIEEVLQTEINDETDTLSDNRRKRRRTEAQVAHLVDNLSQQQLPSLTNANQGTKF